MVSPQQAAVEHVARTARAAECLQHLKLLWHVLVIAGHPLHGAA